MSAIKRDAAATKATNSPFGRAIRARRKAQRLTQAETAQLLGVQTQTVSQWELGSKSPQPRFYTKLVEFLDLPDQTHLRQLIERRESKEPRTRASMGELVRLVQEAPHRADDATDPDPPENKIEPPKPQTLTNQSLPTTTTTTATPNHN